ncbi:MAG: type VI secretion system baseplate subunit TssK [Gemmatimonadaceae bacterium]|nr:type VI secretion system baseplate subunit TssK [Gemmatimonadaceae bacterium]
MPQLTRVAWSEGMHLSQHHFQAQARYAEDSIAFTVAQLVPAAHGLVRLALDGAALARRIVAVHDAAGLMPDGLAFDMPHADAPPPSLDLAQAWPAGAERATVWLVVARRGTARGDVALDAHDARARYVRAERERSDDFAGHDLRAIPVCRKNFRLTCSPAMDDEVALPLVRLRRTPTGDLVPDASFLPPLLHIGASDGVRTRLQRLVDVLVAKSAALAPGGDDRAMLANYAARELPTFWLLHTVRGAIPALRHLLHAPGTHPEALYLELARLAGSLCTFALDTAPGALPPYDHDEPARWLDALERHIRTHLELVVPGGCIVLPLARVTEVLHTATIDDPRARDAARWYLGLAAAVPDATLRGTAPTLVKVAAAHDVLRLVREALPGATLEHVPVPPAALAADPRRLWFRIARRDPAIDGVARSHEIGVYVPTTLPDARLELRILLDD